MLACAGDGEDDTAPSSIAVHCTNVLPIGNVKPEGLSQDIVMLTSTSSPCLIILFSSSVAVPSTLSSAVTVNVTRGPQCIHPPMFEWLKLSFLCYALSSFDSY
jgi:hypothetical protein